MSELVKLLPDTLFRELELMARGEQLRLEAEYRERRAVVLETRRIRKAAAKAKKSFTGNKAQRYRRRAS